MNFANLPISDAHIHVFWNMTLDKREELLSRVMAECGYGTDIGSNTVDTDGSEAAALYRMVRGFLENDAPFEELGWQVPPMKMPENILRKIYKDNMMAFYQGKAPKALDYTVMKRELDTVLNEWEIFLNIDDLANLNLIKTIF